MGAYGALESSEHGEGMLVLHRDDAIGRDGGDLLFGVCDDVGSVWGRLKCCAGDLEVLAILLDVGEECSCGI